MAATVIDGKAFAATVRDKVKTHVTRLVADHGITPGLAVVLVGEDPASQVYVRSKGKMTVEVGMKSVEHKLDVNTSEADLLAVIDQLNNDPEIHGILCQLPLPKHLDEDLIINSISPAKDVDGFHISNVGLLQPTYNIRIVSAGDIRGFASSPTNPLIIPARFKMHPLASMSSKV